MMRIRAFVLGATLAVFTSPANAGETITSPAKAGETITSPAKAGETATSPAKAGETATSPANGLISAYRFESYTVKQGGTLWDIGREKLANPYTWPRVWQVNPEIKHADRLYPGQVIRIPVELLKPELRPAEAPQVEPPKVEAPKAVKTKTVPIAAPIPAAPAETPVTVMQAEYLAEPDVMASAGFVSSDLAVRGHIKGSPTGRAIFGKDDSVYITLAGDEAAKRYSIFRKVRDIIHPITKLPAGTLYEELGSVEVTGPKTAVIAESFNQIENGSMLGDYIEQSPALVSASPRRPGITGHVLTLKEFRRMVGLNDILYLDKGGDAGIEAGDAFGIIHKTVSKDEAVADVRILRVMPNTSTAIVIRGIEEIGEGDEFGQMSGE
ncbi:MAG: LysM peptidoglycan-binding domain-containing protein [Nitrospirae bacterium]|nr:LysM peptidoglycan-binding domain-containing protein [Nitrospirota bacterium]